MVLFNYKKYPVITYCLLTFLITWGLKYIYVLVKVDSGMLAFNFSLIAQFGPTIAALILFALTEGWTGINRIINSIINWRIGFRWLSLAALFEPVMFISLTILYFLINDIVYLANEFNSVSNIFVLFLTFLTGLFRWGISEEIGWSGWMLPKLQIKISPFFAAIILAFVTTLWHINPELFITEIFVFKKGAYLYGYYSKVFEQLVISIPITLVTVYIYNNTKGSLLAMIIFHSASNTSYFWIKETFGIVETEFYRAAFLILLIVIMIIFSLLVLKQKIKVISYK